MKIPPLSVEQMHRALKAANDAVPDLHPIAVFTIPRAQDGDEVSPQMSAPPVPAKHICESLLGILTTLSLQYKAPWAEELKTIADRYFHVD